MIGWVVTICYLLRVSDVSAQHNPDELNHELLSTITGLDKEIQSISIIDDEILWPVQINIMSYRENSWISVKVLCELNFPTNFNLFMLFGGFHLSTPVKWHENNGKVCEKRSELISRQFKNDDEILSRLTRVESHWNQLGHISQLTESFYYTCIGNSSITYLFHRTVRFWWTKKWWHFAGCKRVSDMTTPTADILHNLPDFIQWSDSWEFVSVVWLWTLLKIMFSLTPIITLLKLKNISLK